MKASWNVGMDPKKIEEVNEDLKKWGYNSREEFVLESHRREKAIREKVRKEASK